MIGGCAGAPLPLSPPARKGVDGVQVTVPGPRWGPPFLFAILLGSALGVDARSQTTLPPTPAASPPWPAASSPAPADPIPPPVRRGVVSRPRTSPPAASVTPVSSAAPAAPSAGPPAATPA